MSMVGIKEVLIAAFIAITTSGELVDATVIIPDLVLDMRYATSNNFVGKQLYAKAQCLLQRQVALQLGKVQADLKEKGFRLKVWDCYRPVSVQRQMWKLVPTPGLVANPKYGSNHNRGAAIDLTMVSLDGSEVEMPTDFDAFVPEAHRNASQGVSAAAKAHRNLLRTAMERHGFRGIMKEWWHFDAQEARAYPVMDGPL